MTKKPLLTVSTLPASTTRPMGFFHRLQMKGVALRRLHDRERRRLRQEFGHVPGLMALLMKPRNGLPWTRSDRATLRAQLRSMRRLGLYVAIMLIPGTAVTLPLLAWWLDRRRARRDSTPVITLSPSRDATKPLN